MRQSAEVEVTLPNGLWQEGICIRRARVRPVPESDTATADDPTTPVVPLRRVSDLLARCVTCSEVRQHETDWPRELPLGDREALLLEIRRLTFGDRIPCTLKCPACSEFMDFDLQAHQLLQHAPEIPAQFREELFSARGTRWWVRFRIPRASDLEAAIEYSDNDPESAVAVVLRNCIDQVRREDGGHAQASEWPAELGAQISARMAELDPQAEIALQLECPACRHAFSSTFDTADYLFHELEAREKQLLYDIHRLALAYHWSENDILGMTPHKRKLYLELLEEGHPSE